MKKSPYGRSLELFFIDGNAEGRLTAKVFNWTGHVLKTPRIQLRTALARQEFSRTGIYLLIGDDDNGEPKAYVGESGDIGVRIKEHVQTKDWWTEAVLVSTSDDSLTIAHAKYLECRLVERLTKVGGVSLDNAVTPPCPSLSEAQQANMEEFLDTLLLVLPALRIDIFLEKKRKMEQESTNVIFELKPSEGDAYCARAIQEGSEFIVLADSIARAEWISPAHSMPSSQRRRQELKRKGVLVEKEDKLRFTENWAFGSTSAAAETVAGQCMNGPTAWRVKGSGQKYSEWEANQFKPTDNEAELTTLDSPPPNDGDNN